MNENIGLVLSPGELYFCLEPLLVEPLNLKRGNLCQKEMDQLHEEAKAYARQLEIDSNGFLFDSSYSAKLDTLSLWRGMNQGLADILSTLKNKQPIFIAAATEKCEYLTDFFAGENKIASPLLAKLRDFKTAFVKKYNKFPDGLQNFVFIPITGPAHIPFVIDSYRSRNPTIPTLIEHPSEQEIFLKSVNFGWMRNKLYTQKGKDSLEIFSRIADQTIDLEMYTTNHSAQATIKVSKWLYLIPETHSYNLQLTANALTTIFKAFKSPEIRIYSMKGSYAYAIAKLISEITETEMRDFGSVMRNTDHPKLGPVEPVALDLLIGHIHARLTEPKPI